MNYLTPQDLADEYTSDRANDDKIEFIRELDIPTCLGIIDNSLPVKYQPDWLNTLHETIYNYIDLNKIKESL